MGHGMGAGTVLSGVGGHLFPVGHTAQVLPFLYHPEPRQSFPGAELSCEVHVVANAASRSHARSSLPMYIFV